MSDAAESYCKLFLRRRDWDEFGGLNAFVNSPLSRESTKWCDRCHGYNSEQLFVSLHESMKGVFATIVASSIRNTLQV